MIPGRCLGRWPGAGGVPGGGSAQGVKQLLVVFGQVVKGFAHDIPGGDTTLAALAGDSQRTVDLAQGAGPVSNGGAYLGVGDSLAEADVHGGRWFPVLDDDSGRD